MSNISNYVVITKLIMNKLFINGVAILSLLAIHEIGHVIIGIQAGCESGKAIILDTTKEGPYAELLCSNTTNYSLAYFGSFISSVIFGALFFILRGSAEKNLFFVILGFSLIFGSLDLVMITGTQLAFYLSIVSGFAIIIFGEYFLAYRYVETFK